MVTTYTHDAAGNRTRVQSPTDLTEYAYDAAGRMATAEPVAGTVTMTYNADGQRVAKQSLDGTTLGYLFDGKKLAHETDDVAGGDIIASFTTTEDQEYGDLVDEDGGEQLFHQFDAQACTNALLDPQALHQLRA